MELLQEGSVKTWSLIPKTCLGAITCPTSPKKKHSDSPSSHPIGAEIFAKSLQLCPNRGKVSSALSCCLLDLLHVLFRDYYVRRDSPHQCMYPLHVCEISFNFYCDGEGLVDPRLNTRLQDCFLVSCRVNLFFQCFGMFLPCELLCEGHRLYSSFDVVILLLEFLHLCL